MPPFTSTHSLAASGERESKCPTTQKNATQLGGNFDSRGENGWKGAAPAAGRRRHARRRALPLARIRPLDSCTAAGLHGALLGCSASALWQTRLAACQRASHANRDNPTVRRWLERLASRPLAAEHSRML